ncbi:tumor necrosis factor receptor superfamily member 10A-like isoform X1 [Micropterus salmoides]|uniref:hematopoietic death receptor isoform X1 n=1 Tax=Micropterus salmoides TaxID=27706 RepID=UPI0018EBFD4D|nr:hematopoietic death receptor isoform X1 [Micropterus salmoides]XP_038595353.1 tumor necrosis factor receptor superfamily member 10A-like isoform X1 [Micropterus salmoides]
MTTFLVCLVLVSIWPLSPTGAFPRIGTDLGGSRTRRDVTCRDGLEYPNGNICCLNCPAGTHMKSPCTIAGEKGKCEECDYGTYTEHANGLEHCFKCTLCHSDQEIVKPCTPSQDTECQCKPGGFCAPDQACEVCKKCSRCGKDEVIGRNCTPTTNTECKKIQPSSGSTSANTWVIVTLSLLAAGAIVVVMAVCVCRRHRATDSQRNLPDGPKAGQQYSDNCPTEEKKNGETRSLSSLNQTRPLVRAKSSVGMEEERKVLCESLSSSASNSQHSLTGLLSHPAPPRKACPMVPRQPNRREDEQFPSLVPVNGVESLRKCFGYFEEVDVNYHKRFFRHLGIMDNVIKSKEDLPYEDRIHELLNIWVEKEGREASLNDLLKALLALNQRRTAETVKENAIHSGQYFCEC